MTVADHALEQATAPTLTPTARWDRHFIDMALLCASMSKDPRTRVGAVIVGPDREVRATGLSAVIHRPNNRPNSIRSRLRMEQHRIVGPF
jgi:deoxycytidylate deaminase